MVFGLGKGLGKGKTALLGDHEVPLVKDGYAVEEVLRYIEDLKARHEQQVAQLQRQTPSEAAARFVARRIMAEADRDATNLRERARRGAEEESGRIGTEARQKAAELMDAAKSQAQSTAEQEAHSILDAASQKAQLLESQALLVAHRFLLRARDEIQERLTSDAREVYDRLVLPVQQLLGITQSIEAEWSTRRIEPWWGTPGDVKDYQTDLLELLFTMGGGLSLESLTSEEVERSMRELRDTPSRPSPTEGAPAQGTPASQASGAGEEAPPVGEAAPSAGGQPLPDVPRPQDGPPGMVPSAGPVVEESEPRDAIEGLADLVLPSSGQSGMYEGEVDLVIVPPVNAARLNAFHRHIQTIPDIKIVRTSGSWDRGTVVTVALETPQPLLGILAQVPLLEADATTPAGAPDQRITIRFQDESEPTDT